MDATEKISTKNLTSSFEIGKYPVTNQWYDEFIRAGGYENKEYWNNKGKKWLEETKINAIMLK
ncbi:MAG: SUMF1/EgtB/PvdO family nonheme iron enzyme [Candidatus Brocadiaceae bacterium]|nr:SUMF1/EgtB/PvdO family nonheme iron enzyme [Candidatus Brocadiaceae bacterium]